MFNQAVHLKYLKTLALSLGLLTTSLSWADTTPKQVRQTEANAQKLAKEVQAQVEKLDAKRQEDFNAWRQARHELLALEAFNQRQAKWNSNLEKELVNLEEQLISLDKTRTELEPLLEQMLARLEELNTTDLPFNLTAKQNKQDYLAYLLTRVDLSLAEKLRQLLVSYRQAVEAGRSLEINKEQLAILPNAPATQHTLLRLGRLGLYALTEDQKQGYVWQAEQEQWQTLKGKQIKQLRLAITLAEQRGLPSLLQLPLSLSLSANSQGGN